ncbi:HEAT repeat domain-containing protein [Kitasatospora sp. NPDC101447]|uniref:HEAT repeat domain-containing protein n=1 Tax=Kitasatospora sp. NPDC101447 TaxID=3364102 RepID=UPI00382EDB02
MRHRPRRDAVRRDGHQRGVRPGPAGTRLRDGHPQYHLRRRVPPATLAVLAVLAVLADGTRDPASEVRRAAVRALGWNRDGTVIDLLVARAENTDRSVRFEAVFALGHQSDPAARAALERLTTDEDANVRDSARRALAPPTGWQ